FRDKHAGPDHLFHNNGDGTFTDVTKQAGIDNTGWGLGVTFLDYDNDGDQDIYVANDFGPNCLFQNDGHGHFRDVARHAGALDYGFGMSASSGDYNNDGNLDIYVSNVYSGTTWYLQHVGLHLGWVRFWDPSLAWEMTKATFHLVRDFGGIRPALLGGKKFGE